MQRIDGSFYTLDVMDEIALAELLDIVFSIGLFERDEDDKKWVRTTGKTINLESMMKEDYDTLRKMNRELNKSKRYEYIG